MEIQNDPSEQTAERLSQFHQQNSEKSETHSEGLLSICSVAVSILSILAGIFLWVGLDFGFWTSLLYAFGGFTTGLLMYVVAKICRLLVEIRDNQNIRNL